MSHESHIKVIIAGGGTGGHIFPAVAIANALKRLQPEVEILFVGAKGKMEMEKIPKEGYRIIGLDIAGLNRGSILKNLTLPYKLILSFIQARRILKEFKPQVAVGVGGYASFPLLFMAQQAGIATLIQEQNSFAGRSNRILGRKAKAICVAYSSMERFFPASRLFHTGNPVREGISKSSFTKEDALKFFELDLSKKVVFVFGGSLGARSINETMGASLDFFAKHQLQLLWQTGTPYYETAKTQSAGREGYVKVREFIREMDAAYTAADIIIARAGASSISELCIVGKPVIFVPFPYASEDHQTHNALALVKHNAAVMVKDAEVKNELLKKLEALQHDERQCKLMIENIQALKTLHADEKIAHKIIELARS